MFGWTLWVMDRRNNSEEQKEETPTLHLHENFMRSCLRYLLGLQFCPKLGFTLIIAMVVALLHVLQFVIPSAYYSISCDTKTTEQGDLIWQVSYHTLT